MLKLYTFNISHFAEKARWTLDYEGIPYEERVLLPGPHQLVTRRIARRTHVPLLEHGGLYVQGSSAIIDHVADRLGGSKLTAVDPIQRAKARGPPRSAGLESRSRPGARIFCRPGAESSLSRGHVGD